MPAEAGIFSKDILQNCLNRFRVLNDHADGSDHICHSIFMIDHFKNSFKVSSRQKPDTHTHCSEDNKHDDDNHHKAPAFSHAFLPSL